MKTTHFDRLVLAIALGLIAVPAWIAMAAPSADVKALFDETYGEAVRGVKSTRSSADDAKLAIVLLDAARKNTGDEGYTIYLLEQAYEFGKLHTDGMRSAADALQELARLVPKRQLETQEKLLWLYEVVFRNAAGKSNKDVHKKAGTATTDLMIEIAQAKSKRAEYNAAVTILKKATGIARAVAYTKRQTEINELVESLAPLAPIDSKIQAARRAITRNPADKEAAADLTNLYLKDLDRPVSAKTYAELIHDAQTQELFTLAGKPVNDLTLQESTRLAKWYESLAAEGSAIAKTNMLIRAKVYYARVIELKSDDASQNAAAKVDLTLASLKVDAEKATELAKSRRDRLGITVAAVRPTPPKPQPKPVPVPVPQPKPDPQPNVKPVPQPKPVDPPVAMAPAEPEPKEVEAEFQEEELSDDYWKNRKSIFDF